MIKKINDPSAWSRWYAWHPVVTLGNRRVWLKAIERRWESKMNFRIICDFDPGDYDGGWQYRLGKVDTK